LESALSFLFLSDHNPAGSGAMSFQMCIDRWREKGEGAAADHVSAALVAFGERHPLVLENLNADVHLTPHLREELLKQLRRVDPNDPVAVVGKVESFCRAHEGIGPRQPTAQCSDLGHVQRRAALHASLTSAAQWNSPFRRKGCSPSLSIDHILRLDLKNQRLWLNGVWLSRFQMWSFYQSRWAEDPFRKVSTRGDELARRLGLGHIVPPVEMLLWTHRLKSHQSATVPTTFDAALSEWFRPGGKTQPLIGDDGLREIVHPAITGDQLTGRIEPTV
jgi:hypothetical protein